MRWYLSLCIGSRNSLRYAAERRGMSSALVFSHQGGERSAEESRRGLIGPPEGRPRPKRVLKDAGAPPSFRRDRAAPWGSMATPRAAVRERAAHRDELPGVSGRAERELEHAVDRGVPYLAVGLHRRDRTRPDPPRAHGELPDAELRIEHPARGLRREALVHLVVRVEHELGPGRVQIVPERLDRIVHGRPCRAEAGVMPDGE